MIGNGKGINGITKFSKLTELGSIIFYFQINEIVDGNRRNFSAFSLSEKFC